MPHICENFNHIQKASEFCRFVDEHTDAFLCFLPVKEDADIPEHDKIVWDKIFLLHIIIHLVYDVC